jgi:hypothetical protein
MNDIIKHIFDVKPKKVKKNHFKKSSMQGYKIVDEKNKKIQLLSNNLRLMSVSNKIIEGQANMNEREFIELGEKKIEITSFSQSQKENIKKIIADFKTDKTRYNDILQEYGAKYRIFIENFATLKQNVDACKVRCNESPLFENNDEKNACKVGCFLNGPYLKECENTFKDTKTDSCNVTAEQQCENYKPKSTHNPNTIVDVNGVNLVDGCCKCGGGKFGAPKKNINGIVYDSCERYDNDNLFKACQKGIDISDTLKTDTISTENLSKTMVERYSEIVALNQEMIDISDRLLKYTNDLKDFNIYVNKNKVDVQNNFKNDQSQLETYKIEIEKLQGKKGNKLNAFLTDSRLKSKAYEMRMYLWSILAIGFATAALYQIKKF